MNKPGLALRILTTDLPVALTVLLALGPFVWIILTSLTPTEQLAAHGVALTPRGWGLDNYIRLFRQTSFAANMGHSLIIALGTMALGLGVSVTAAYAFSRFRFAGREVALSSFLVTRCSRPRW